MLDSLSKLTTGIQSVQRTAQFNQHCTWKKQSQHSFIINIDGVLVKENIVLVDGVVIVKEITDVALRIRLWHPQIFLK